MKDKNGSVTGYVFCGEVCGFSGVIRSGKTYYVPLESGGGNKTRYFRFDNNKNARKVYHSDGVTPNDKEMKDINDQRYKQ